MIYLLGLAALATTLIGGAIALRFRDRLHLIAGFSAGAIIGVAVFELLPESAEQLGEGGVETASMLIAAGFVLYLILDRLVLRHTHDENGEHHHRPKNGKLGAASLVLHSFFDGLVIGLAFQVSPAVGWVVTAAVLVHDFSDGINTVVLALRGSDRKSAFRWLLAGAAAPLAGIATAQTFAVSNGTLGMVLAVMCGCFLYIGASDLLPESQHAHPKRLTTVMTLIGMAVMLAVIRIAH